MRNAILSVLWLLLLGTGSWASEAAAQTDDTLEADEDVAEADVPAEDGSRSGADSSSAESEAADEEPVDMMPRPPREALAAPEVVAESDAAETAEAPEEPTEEAEEEAPAGPEPLPWRNTFFSWTHQVTFNSFIRDAQLSYDPVYQQSFSLAPRWYAAPTSYFLVSQGLFLEVTDGLDARNRDPQIGDTVIEYRHMIPWEGFMFMAQARIGLPISKLSLAAQRYMQWGLGLTVVRTVPEINLTLAGIFAYRNWLAGSNVVQVGEPQPDRCPRAPPPSGGTGTPEIDTTTCDQVGGVSAARDTILAGISATIAIDDFSINFQGFLFILQGYDLAPAYVNVATSQEPLMIADGSPSHWRNFTYFALTLGYQVTTWLNLSLGIQNSGFVASAWNPDGSIRSPFNPDTQVFISATAQIDTIYTELAGSDESGLTPEERQRRRQGLASGPSTEVSF